MTGRAFVDTNVLVYAIDKHEPVKRAAAVEVLAFLEDRFVVVPPGARRILRDSDSQAHPRPSPSPRPPDEFSELSQYDTVLIDASLVRAAIETSQQSQISYWDALIVEAAAAAGCSALFTEDLAAGSVIRGVEVVNPFA